MKETELHELLNRASEHQDAPELVSLAVSISKRRLAYRRTGLAAAAAAIVVIGIVLVPRIAGPSPDPVDEPTSIPSPIKSALPDTGPATQPIWNLSSIKPAPVRTTKLPQQIDFQSARGPSLQEQPMSSIVAALAYDNNLQLLDVDGTWRSVSLTTGQGVPFSVSDVVRPSISSDGTRVAVAVEAGIRVIDVSTDTERTVPWPKQFAPPWDNTLYVVWRPGDDGFIVADATRTWMVGLDGSSQKTPYGGHTLGIDPEGPVYESEFKTRTLVTWVDGTVVNSAPFIQCERIVAGYGMVACTAGNLEPFQSGPVVLDPVTGDIIAYAPMKDPNAIYSDNGGLTLLGFLDKDTLLMLVGPATFQAPAPEGERVLATWQFRTGKIQRISTGDAALRSISVALNQPD